MLSSFLVIQDSEDESSDNNAHYQEDEMDPPPPATSTGSSSYLRSPSLSSGPGQISGEAREKAIKEAQSLLLAPPFDTPDTPGAQPELVKVATAARRKTANGLLEGNISREMDVYDFLVDGDDDGDFFTPPRDKKRKRAAKRSKSVAEESEGLPYENQNAEPGKRRESGAAAGRSKSIPDMLQDECSEDDWTPNSKIEKPAGKKSTRSNTNEKELAPLLPKPKRKLKSGALVSSNQFDGDLSLGINIDHAIGQSEESSRVQVHGNEPNFNRFMVDLTSEDFLLATQRKAEYEALSLTGSSDATFLPVNFAGRESDAEEYPVLSTIPDPPSDGLGQSELWDLDHNQSIAVLPPQPRSQPPPQPPLLLEQLSNRMVSSPLSSPPMGKSSAGPPSSAAQIVISKEMQSDNTSKAARSNRSAKRRVTDGSINAEGYGRVASEWRVAKGRSKTMHTVVTLSDDEDHLAQEIPEKKKTAVRQRKSAAVSEGAKKGARGGAAAAAAKQGKGKRKGKAVVNDSEDDGTFSDGASAQHPISSPKGAAAADDIAALHSEQTPGRRRPGDQVMVAVAIESPSKPAQKCKSTAGDAEKIDPLADIMESNSDPTHGMPQHDYESAPPSPKPVIPAKRAVSGASAGGRKKKTKQEVEDEDMNWDEKPKKAAKKGAVKSRNAKVGGKMSVTRGRVNSKKVLDTTVEAITATEDKEEIEAPSPKPAAKGRAAKAKVIRKLPMEAEEEEVVEQNLEEAEEDPALLETPSKSKSAKAATTASASEVEDKKETPAPTEPGADIKSPGSETGATPAPPERKSATPASDSKKASTATPGRVPFRVGLSRRSRIPSLLRGFRK